MSFTSNKCIAIHVEDLGKAEKFYCGVLGFKLLNRTEEGLELDTGYFLLYINRSEKPSAPIPSFTVNDFDAAKKRLLESGCDILVERGRSLYFKDPFGFVYDIIEE